MLRECERSEEISNVAQRSQITQSHYTVASSHRPSTLGAYSSLYHSSVPDEILS